MAADHYVDWEQPSIYFCLFMIAFNPTFWNIVAQNEYRNKSITKFFSGNALRGCYALAATIFSLGMIRDSIYSYAIQRQPKHSMLPEPYATLLPIALFVVGQTLVLSSTWVLGITGTFLGDYFGILMDHRVESFPFNIIENPMYDGSVMCFVAGALWYERPAGLMITAIVYVAYTVALGYESPFTAMIYKARDTAASKPASEAKKDL